MRMEGEGTFVHSVEAVGKLGDEVNEFKAGETTANS